MCSRMRGQRFLKEVKIGCSWGSTHHRLKAGGAGHRLSGLPFEYSGNNTDLEYPGQPRARPPMTLLPWSWRAAWSRPRESPGGISHMKGVISCSRFPRLHSYSSWAVRPELDCSHPHLSFWSLDNLFQSSTHIRTRAEPLHLPFHPVFLLLLSWEHIFVLLHS